MVLDALKCNCPHKLEYYRDIAWCYKANFKMNLLRLEKKEINPACINSSMSIVKVNTKPTVMHAHSGNTTSIRSSMLRNTKSFVKTEANQFTQLWVGQIHEFKKPKDFFTEFSKEQTTYRDNFRK